MPQEYFVWKLVWETGWTLDTIRSLSMRDISDYLSICDGMAKANKK
jgi:hypothetical protein